jgi:hypothetical protein
MKQAREKANKSTIMDDAEMPNDCVLLLDRQNSMMKKLEPYLSMFHWETSHDCRPNQQQNKPLD